MTILNTTTLQGFTGAAVDLFDTASQFHFLTVIKEPQKVIIDVNNNEYNGYGPVDTDNYTLIPNSGVYNVVVVSIDKSFDNTPFTAVPVQLAGGDKLVKVREDCKNYIENGKNILFILDGQEFNETSTAMPRNYGGLVYWYYNLSRTT